MTEPNFKYFHPLRKRLHIIVFGTDTPAGKLFDIILLWAILISIANVSLESVSSLKEKYELIFKTLEWLFTVLFTLEYIIRIFITKNPRKYIFSYFGIIDLLALLPTYIAIFVTGGSYLVVIRALRLLRIFRILKLTRYVHETQVLLAVLKGSQHKILIFMGSVSTLVIIMGTLMYLIEGGNNGFTSIPRSIYWAVVTVTTVGYGDIAPQTTLGQAFATVLMLTGFAIIAVPTSIVSSEMTKLDDKRQQRRKKKCPKCKFVIESTANYCSRCGEEFKGR